MDDDSGYELDDPKHPTFHDRYADQADRRRKQAKEEGIPVIVISDEGVNPGILTSLDEVIIQPCNHDMQSSGKAVTGRQHDGQEATVYQSICSKCGYEEWE